jgi:hypothetical protein
MYRQGQVVPGASCGVESAKDGTGGTSIIGGIVAVAIVVVDISVAFEFAVVGKVYHRYWSYHSVTVMGCMDLGMVLELCTLT